MGVQVRREGMPRFCATPIPRFSPVPRHLLEAGRVRRCIEQAECACRDARVSANSRQHGAAVRTIKKKIATELEGRRGGAAERRERERKREGERERERVHTVLILLDAEEADSINSHGREKRNDVVLVRAVVRDETATVVTLSGASGTESIHRSMGHTASADYRPE